IYVDPLFGPIVIGNNVFNVGGSGIEITGASGNVTVLNNTVNAVGVVAIYLHDNSGDVGDKVSIVGNTIGNDNSFGNIGLFGILVDNQPGTYLGGVLVQDNRIGVDTDGAGGLTPATVFREGVVVRQAAGAVAVSGNTIARTGATGILVSDSATDVTVGGNTIDGATHAGISIVGIANGDALVQGNRIDNATGAIVIADVHGAVDVLDNRIGLTTAIAGNGISVLGNSLSGAIHVTGNRLIGDGAGTLGNGIVIDSNGTTLAGVSVAGNTISGVGHDGILIDHASNAAVIGNTMTAIGQSGIEMAVPVSNVTVSGNTINGAGQGIYLHDAVGNASDIVSLAGNVIDNVAGSGMSLANIGTGQVRIGGNRFAAGVGSTIGGNAVSASAIGTLSSSG